MLRRGSVFVLVAACGVRLAAQESRDTARVSPIVVTATRTPLTQGALPVAVTIIAADELRLRGITTVAEALRDVTSAYVAQSGSQGGQTSLFLRGGESKYVKVLVDGVPVNDPGGFYDFSSLTTDNVERIEIVRGPASVVHGADAVTGVVHVITKRGRGAARTTIDARVGMAPRTSIATTPAPESLNSLDLSAEAAGAFGETSSYSLGLARHETSGLYEINNRYYSDVLSGRVDLEPAAGTRVRLTVRYTDLRFNYPTNGAGDVGDVNSNRTEDRAVIGVALERDLTAKLRASLTVKSSLHDGVSDDPADSAADASSLIQDKTRRRGADLQLHWLAAEAASVTAGVALELQDHRQTLQSRSSFGPFMSSFRAERGNKGAYGELVLSPTADFTATVGTRVDDNETFGAFTTHRVGVSYRPIRDTRLRLTFGNAFREPTFTENYASGFATGNPELEAERTASWDVGVDQGLMAGRIALSATYFAQRFTNMIDYDPADSCGFSYCNVAEATSNGLEVDARGRVIGVLWASAGATFLETEVIEPGFDPTSAALYVKGESLIRRPGRKVTAELTYRAERRPSISLRVHAVGKRTDRDFHFPFSPAALPSYTRVDLGAEYQLAPLGLARTALTLRAENVTDEEYQNVYNYLAPRRTLVLGVRSEF